VIFGDATGRRRCQSESMVPRRQHANGLPWLIWIGVHAWECQGCGERGTQPRFTSVRAFAKWAGDVKRAHARCGRPIILAAGEVGHPLNPDRKER
jgi:hypothetical protein